MLLDERTAVITGAASGIGLALTERCLDEGMAVVMADIDGDQLHRHATRLADGGATVTPVVCDVSSAAEVEALRDAALGAHGSVHLLVNNAGVGAPGPSWKTTPEVWDWVVGVDLLGVAYGCSTFVPLMVEQGEGHVVNTASEAGLVATPLLGAYHAAKYGVVGLSEALRHELEGTGVGVSCLCPELVDTRIFESTRSAPVALGLRPPTSIPIEQIEQMLGSKAMNPADVAGQVVYAVQTDTFWVITHATTQRRAVRRNDALAARRNPSFAP